MNLPVWSCTSAATLPCHAGRHRHGHLGAAPSRCRNPARSCLTDCYGRRGQIPKRLYWADHTIADQQYVVKVDPNIKTDVTAIIGCAVMTGAGAVINTAKVQANESVAIFGVGVSGSPRLSGPEWPARIPLLPWIWMTISWPSLKVLARPMW